MEGNTIILIASILILGILYYIDYKTKHSQNNKHSHI
jgi:hypothetical protein